MSAFFARTTTSPTPRPSATAASTKPELTRNAETRFEPMSPRSLQSTPRGSRFSPAHLKVEVDELRRATRRDRYHREPRNCNRCPRGRPQVFPGHDVAEDTRAAVTVELVQRRGCHNQHYQI